jgi:D-glycero-alpha-D-manno-heptose-7-phosphate kinase
MHPLFNSNGYHLKYFKNEYPNTVDEIKHPIIKTIFQSHNIYGVDFNSSSDVPSGTGLGSSSSFTVGLLSLCKQYNKIKVNKGIIAREACMIEINDLKSPIGKQDQYAAALGGMNYIEFGKEESVNVKKISFTKLKELEDSLILFYLGGSREAGSVLTDQKSRIKENMPTLRKIAGLGRELKKELDNDCLDNFGRILHDGWMYKKELSYNITNGAVDYWYAEGLKHGAEGGKLLGGGSTGFMLFYAPKAKHILRANLRLYELPFKFEDEGTQIIYHG